MSKLLKIIQINWDCLNIKFIEWTGEHIKLCELEGRCFSKDKKEYCSYKNSKYCEERIEYLKTIKKD